MNHCPLMHHSFAIVCSVCTYFTEWVHFEHCASCYATIVFLPPVSTQNLIPAKLPSAPSKSLWWAKLTHISMWACKKLFKLYFPQKSLSLDLEGRFSCQCCHLSWWMGRRPVEQRGPDLASHSPAKKLASHWVLLNLYLCYCSELVFASLKTISLVFVLYCGCICICIWTWPCSLKTIRRPISPGAIQFPSCHCQGLLFTKALLIAWNWAGKLLFLVK